MKPVTASDVARLSNGRVTDADEQNRIFDAIAADPELERLFMLLTEDLDDDDTPASPEESARLAAAREHQTLLAKSRLCGLSRGLPSSSDPAPSAVSMNFLWRDDRESATCTFKPLADQPGAWRLSTSLPAHVKVLAVVVAVCRFEDSDDLTRRNVHTDWSSRPIPATALEARGARMAALSTELAARASGGNTEHRGETINLVVLNNEPWSARVIRSTARPGETKQVPPLPLLLTAFDAANQSVASEARLMLEETELLTNLFPDCVRAVTHLEVRPLGLRHLYRLGSTESATLIGSSPYSVRITSDIAACPGEYIVNLGDTEVCAHLDHTDSVICLQIAELEQEVQYELE